MKNALTNSRVRRPSNGLLFSGGASMLALALAICVCAAPMSSQPGQGYQRVMIRSSGSHDQLRQQVQAAGGRILQDFHNVNAVSAELSLNGLAAIAGNPDFTVAKDPMMFLPNPSDLHGMSQRSVKLNSMGVIRTAPGTLLRDRTLAPADYAFNNGLINATVVQARGNTGQGIIVASIDSGVANNPSVVPSLAGNVIGGESFVADPGFSATSTKNLFHGTAVMTMTAAHALFFFPNTDCFAQAVKFNSPASALDGAQFGSPDSTVVPMQGVAPGVSIYAIKVIGHDALGAFPDDLVAGMDRVITMKKNFLAGKPSVPVSGSGTEDDPFVYDSLNIQVANMSLGGLTTYAGHDVFNELVNQMTDADIVVTIAAGNFGDSGLTMASPGDSSSSVTVGAAETPEDARIFIDSMFPQSCSIGFGLKVRPSPGIHAAFFSSRGPTADGRYGVDVISDGEFTFVQFADGSIFLGSGTSSSAPTAAGAAALIRKAVPKASALQVRDALILAANPAILDDMSTRFDQGSGYIDVAASIKLLQNSFTVQAGLSGHLIEWLSAAVGNSPPDGLGLAGYHPTDSVERNIAFLGLNDVDLVSSGFSGKVRALVPGQRQEFIVDIPKDILNLHIHINDITPTLPPQQQNQLFGDYLLIFVHTAKTSDTEFADADYPVGTFVTGPTDFDIDHPEPGLMRITFTGVGSNAGPVAGSFVVTATREGKPAFEKAGKINNGDQIVIPVNVPVGTAMASFELTFDHDWSAYPTNDLDMVLVDPNGNLNFDGATLNGRERAVVQNPTPGAWQVQVIGFDIKGKLGADGNIIPNSKQEDMFDFKLFLQ